MQTKREIVHFRKLIACDCIFFQVNHKILTRLSIQKSKEKRTQTFHHLHFGRTEREKYAHGQTDNDKPPNEFLGISSKARRSA